MRAWVESAARGTALSMLSTRAAFMSIVVQIGRAAGLVRLGTVAVDGTKVRANASKHKAMSYDRMQQEEKRLSEEIASDAAERCTGG